MKWNSKRNSKKNSKRDVKTLQKMTLLLLPPHPGPGSNILWKRILQDIDNGSPNQLTSK